MRWVRAGLAGQAPSPLLGPAQVQRGASLPLAVSAITVSARVTLAED